MIPLIAILGSTGCLGQALVRSTWPPNWQGLPVPRSSLDIRDALAVERWAARERPSLVINCAAFTDVDGCERDPSLASSVNEGGARHLASACREIGARMIQISTDMVFGGPGMANGEGGVWRVSSTPTPINSYGRSKLAGERAVQSHLGNDGSRCCIVRTSWLMGSRGWLPWAASLARKGGTVEIDNLSSLPTLASDLAAGLLRLSQDLLSPSGAPLPILHFANSAPIGRHDLLRLIDLAVNDGRPRLTIRSPSSPLPNRAPRASWSVLNCREWEHTYGPIPHWGWALASLARTLARPLHGGNILAEIAWRGGRRLLPPPS